MDFEVIRFGIKKDLFRSLIFQIVIFTLTLTIKESQYQ